MRFTIRKVDITDLFVQQALRSMFDETFAPEDWTGPPAFNDGIWWIAYAGKEAAGFSGIVPALLVPNAYYIKATGVLPKFRGHGLQKRMYRKHEQYVRALGAKTMVTETINHNAPSGNSLISCGYRMFNPKHPWGSPYAVFWKKDL